MLCQDSHGFDVTTIRDLYGIEERILALPEELYAVSELPKNWHSQERIVG